MRQNPLKEDESLIDKFVEKTINSRSAIGNKYSNSFSAMKCKEKGNLFEEEGEKQIIGV